MKPSFRMGAVWLVMATVLMLLAGCANTPTVSEAPPTPKQTEQYTIGPGDSLQIFVRDNPTLSIAVPVRPDGRISIPLVQSIMAAGKTPDELATDLEKSLAKYIRSPLVTVIVKGFVGSFDQQVRVVGQAVKPTAVPYRRGMTLLDVMIEVGGLTQFANGNDAKIIRHLANGQVQTIKVKLADLMNGAIKDNVAMHPGDILMIPQSFF